MVARDGRSRQNAVPTRCGDEESRRNCAESCCSGVVIERDALVRMFLSSVRAGYTYKQNGPVYCTAERVVVERKENSGRRARRESFG